jgi:hypothetical protein
LRHSGSFKRTRSRASFDTNDSRDSDGLMRMVFFLVINWLLNAESNFHVQLFYEPWAIDVPDGKVTFLSRGLSTVSRGNCSHRGCYGRVVVGVGAG